MWANRALSRTLAAFGLLLSVPVPTGLAAQKPTRTLVAVLAHPDDETPAGPVLARYAREGVQVYLLIASDGGAASGGNPAAGGPTGSDSAARKADMGSLRVEEARHAAAALGAQPPIFLGFPDAKLGDFTADRSLGFRLTARIAEELARLRPDAVITWGPDGGYGHPDHRIMSSIVTQLARAGAPGVPERVFYMYISPEGFRAANPQRGAPPLVAPQEKYLTMRVAFTPADLDASRRAMACHGSQFTPEALDRISDVQARFWNGSVPMAPAFPGLDGTDLFR